VAQYNDGIGGGGCNQKNNIGILFFSLGGGRGIVGITGKKW
jgi:hypothetical protein